MSCCEHASYSIPRAAISPQQETGRTPRATAQVLKFPVPPHSTPASTACPRRYRERELLAQCSRRFGRSEVAYAGKYNLFRLCNLLRIVGSNGVPTQMIERLLHRCEIAGLVIHNCDHNSPFVLGSSRAICLSLQHAARRARANALNRASIL